MGQIYYRNLCYIYLEEKSVLYIFRGESYHLALRKQEEIYTKDAALGGES